MSNLKKDVGQRRSVPRVGCQEVEIGEEELAAVLLPRVISVGHENNVFLNVFLDNKPRTATEAEALSLADGVKPIAVVSANLAPRFKLNDIAFLLSEELAEKTAVIDFSEEADALAVAALGWREMVRGGDASHLFFVEVSDWQQEFPNLLAGQLREKIRLVLHGVGRRCEPCATVWLPKNLCVMACGNAVVGKSDALFKSSEFDEAVAHHVRIRRKSAFDAVCHVGHHAVVVFLLKVNHFQMQSVAACRGLREFDVFFRRARHAFAFHSNFNIEEVGLESLFAEQMRGHSAVNAARNQ